MTSNKKYKGIGKRGYSKKKNISSDYSYKEVLNALKVARNTLSEPYPTMVADHKVYETKIFHTKEIKILDDLINKMENKIWK